MIENKIASLQGTKNCKNFDPKIVVLVPKRKVENELPLNVKVKY
jgi:hypothetical protein